MDQRIKDLLSKTIRTTHPLAEEGAVSGAKFLVTLLGFYRISFTTLRDILYLSNNETCGASILALARKILEHTITIDYMILKGKARKSEQFQNYSTVQAHQELDLIKMLNKKTNSLSAELNLQDSKEIEKKYNSLSHKIRNNKTWSGKNIDEMLRELNEAGEVKEDDSSRLISGYIWGSRLNHPNPMVTMMYLDAAAFVSADTFFEDLGAVIALSMHLRLATRLIDESRNSVEENIYKDIASEISKIQDELFSLS